MHTVSSSLRRAIIVSALGYFIDVLDIQLFAVLRVASLTELGVPADRLALVGGAILNAQIFGMVCGAFLWGWLGDRLGRLKALYGSILIYSLGTIACSFVQDPMTYGVLRFITGFGLAGETGAAVTLIAEMMSPKKRGWGMAILAGFGFLGPATAVIVSWFAEWRTTYVVAGILGLLLFVLRIKLIEPALFEKVRTSESRRGDLRTLMRRHLGSTFLLCVLIGFACIYTWSLLNFFSAELGRAVLGTGVVFNQKTCLLLFYIGASCGDFLSAALSQIYRSRRRTLAAFLVLSLVVSQFYLVAGPVIGLRTIHLYFIYLLLGLGSGSWILMCTLAAEQFGTNIRATTAILVSNLARGFTIPLIFAFQELCHVTSNTNAAALIGAALYAIALLALSRLRETHGIDLDYVETAKTRPST